MNGLPHLPFPVEQKKPRIKHRACAECNRIKRVCSGGVPCERCVSINKVCYMYYDVTNRSKVQQAIPPLFRLSHFRIFPQPI